MPLHTEIKKINKTPLNPLSTEIAENYHDPDTIFDAADILAIARITNRIANSVGKAANSPRPAPTRQKRGRPN